MLVFDIFISFYQSHMRKKKITLLSLWKWNHTEQEFIKIETEEYIQI